MRDIFEYNHQKQNFRLKNRFNWILSDNKKSLENLGKYHNKYRKEFYYISADKDLWYIKRKPTTTMSIIDKPSLVIMFAVMHRLSELSRYEPEKLFKHLNQQQNWLLSEFIEKSLHQFINEISTEITGNEFRTTGFRNLK